MINIYAYAKLNLSLNIKGVRNDGYHLIDTVMQTVSLCDIVTVSENDDNKINIICSDTSICGNENICYKAVELFFEKVSKKSGITVNIEKRIPVAAGMGGGSADAAAVLNGLNKLYGMPLSYSELCVIGLKLGADVPFCIKGATALVKGIGEDILFVKRKLPLYFILIKEGEKPSTKEMYNQIDKIKVIGLANNDNLIKALENNDYSLCVSSLYNDFSNVWKYNNIKEDLLQSGADAVSLSGSGPTVFGVFKNEKAANIAYEKLKGKYTNIYTAFAVGE